jgi:hypothetical protein
MTDFSSDAHPENEFGWEPFVELAAQGQPGRVAPETGSRRLEGPLEPRPPEEWWRQPEEWRRQPEEWRRQPDVPP